MHISVRGEGTDIFEAVVVVVSSFRIGDEFVSVIAASSATSTRDQVVPALLGL